MLNQAPELLRHKPNESEKFIPYINGATVFYKSGEVFENLRAETLDGCIIDEYRQQRPELFSRIIRPMLTRRNGWLDAFSTPNGFDHFYDLAEMAKGNPEWGFFHAPSTECWWWTPEEIASVRSTMTEAEFAQEVLAEFRDLKAGRAYPNYGEHNRRRTNPFTRDLGIVASHLPVLLSPDFNINPMAWSLGQQNGQSFYYFDEIWLPNSNTPEASKELVQRLLVLRDAGLLKGKPQVVVCGDATSKSRQRAAAGKSDYDIMLAALREAGITFDNRTPDSNPNVKDRVNNFNVKCRAADGSVHFWLHPDFCKKLDRDLTRVVWKPGASFTLDQTTDPTLTHASDGPGYSMHELSPIPDIRPVGKLRVLLR